jgi:hypothetical protein
VLELHQPLRLCRPPPELIGQRDLKLKCGRKLSHPPAMSFCCSGFGTGRRLAVLKRHEAARHADYQSRAVMLRGLSLIGRVLCF